MVDYSQLKQKFPPKRTAPFAQGRRPEAVHPLHRKSTRAAVKAIAREYELKRAALGATPTFRRGPLFYAFVVLALIALGSLVLSAARGGLSLGKARVDRKALQARKSMDALSVALGRYKFHVGEYPTTEEGLAVLAYRKPDEIRRVRRRHQAWDGPYVNHVVDDPWGNAYVYETRPEGGTPVLYSKGPDGRAGTTDDVLPELLSFDAPFRDSTWTNGWAPCELRGVVVAPDEATRRRVQEEMKQYD